MKYKAGDKVRVRSDLVVGGIYGNYSFASGMKPLIGKSVTIDEIRRDTVFDDTYRIKGNMWRWTDEMFESLEQSIHIYTDGATTTAILREGKKTVKKALAVCNPRDVFDFKIGASLALDRLLDRKPYSEPDKPTFDWDTFETQKIAVHCDTEEKAKAFLKECHDRGLAWQGGRDLLNRSNWNFHREETCYTSGVTFAAKSYCEKEGYTIVPCPVTAKPEQPTYYNGKVVCVDTNGGGYHTVGKIYECKDGLLDSDIGKGRHNYIPYKSFEALQYHALPKFVELVED